MKAKKILLFIIIILLLIIGVLAIVYYKTDVFKSSSQKFWKYANQNMEFMDLFNNQDMQEIRNKRSNNPYEVSSVLNINKDGDSYIITANTSAKDSNNLVTDVNFEYNNKKIIDFVLAKKSNLVSFMSKELANGFIAIKNNNIQELAKEAGMEDVSNIPDSINWTSLIDVLYVQESDEKYFIETYSKLIEENISKENYTEEQSGVKINDDVHSATGYKLVLTENETKEIAKKILSNIKDEDARAINFISSRLKLLNVPKKYTEHDAIAGEVSKLIEQIDSIETTDEKLLEATVYVENKQTIQANIKIKDGSVIKIIFKRDENKLYIIQDSKNEYLAKSSNPILSHIGNIKEITLSNNISDDKNSSTIEFKAQFFNNFNIEYNSKITIGESGSASIEFENTPRVVLNELESENLKSTYKTIVYGLGKIYENKKAMLNNNSTTETQNRVESQENIENSTATEADTIQGN